jgi:hypothetical protein
LEIRMPDLASANYSETDASNNQPAPNGMPEGMAPSGVNDAWRAGMAAVKRSYDRDHAGSWCTVGGTANAVTLTYAVAPAGYVQGEKYAFKALAANTGAVTVNVNGLGAKSLFRHSSSGAIACAGGEIQAGDLVEIEFDGTQFQLMGQSTFAGGTLTTTTMMSGAAFNEAFVGSAQAVAGGVLDISGIAANAIDLTQSGNAAITSFGSVPVGARRILRFTGATPGQLVNSANLALPNATTISIGQYDVAQLYWVVTGVAVLESYTRYGGAPIYGAASAATTLAGTDATQFLTAAGLAGNKSLAANGYYKFPGNFLVQWGSISLSGSGMAAVVFPVAFPTACQSVLTTYQTTAPPTNSCTAGAITNSGFSAANGSSTTQVVNWVAFGY